MKRKILGIVYSVLLICSLVLGVKVPQAQANFTNMSVAIKCTPNLKGNLPISNLNKVDVVVTVVRK